MIFSFTSFFWTYFYCILDFKLGHGPVYAHAFNVTSIIIQLYLYPYIYLLRKIIDYRKPYLNPSFFIPAFSISQFFPYLSNTTETCFVVELESIFGNDQLIPTSKVIVTLMRVVNLLPHS